MMMIHLFALSLVCKDCKHFIVDKQECRKFKNIDIITGAISYDSARFARRNSELCGEKGLLFEKNELKVITEPYYFVKSNWLTLIAILLILGIVKA